MNEEFRPSKKAFMQRLLWSSWPLALVFFTGLFNFYPDHQGLYDHIAIAVFTLGIVRAVWLRGRTLKFRQGSLIITDWFNKDLEFDLKLIEHPGIETIKRGPFPFSQILKFSYKEAGDFKYMLSELSQEDRLRAIRLLYRFFPVLREGGKEA